LNLLRRPRAGQVKDAGSPTTRACTKARERVGRLRTPRWTALGVVIAFVGTLTYASASVVQQGNLRITLISQVQPYKLPRTGTAPIAILVSGHVAPVSGVVPEQLEGLKVRVNRHARLQSRGLPYCRIAQIQPATSARALANCGQALIGSGQFWAHIVLPDQGAYPTQGRLLVFNGVQHGRRVLFAQIFTSNPFATSFVIVFRISRVNDGYYGTELRASLPEALGDWGYVDRIKLTLKRKYRYRGRRLSYFNAACPAIPGTKRTSFHLAYATFSFANRKIGAQVDKSCGVRE
jgi:hypothetical protein